MARFPHSTKTKRRSVSKNSPRKYMHGGVAHNCPGGYMMQNGGCVPVNSGGYKKGGKVKKYSHGGEAHSRVNRTRSNMRRSGNSLPGTPVTGQPYGRMCSDTYGPYCGPGLYCYQGMCIYQHDTITVTPTRVYSHGGGVHSEVNRTTSNPITGVNLQAGPNDGFRYAYNNMPYQGPYHVHADGTMMIGAGTLGATHEARATEVIVQGPVNTRTAVNTRARRISPNPTGSRNTTNMNRSSMSGGSGYRKGGKVRNTRRKAGGRRRLR